MNRFATILLLSVTPILAQPKAPDSHSSLAIVALPDYVDATGSKNYSYLGPSLSDAIDASMQKRFDYIRADKKAVDREVKKLWRPGQVPLDSDVKQVAILTKSDYVIVGSYTLNKKKTQVTFSTRIFIAPDRFIQVPDVTNAVDATLFDATNRVAAEIVRVIEADAREQQAKQAASAKAASQPGDKITLAKATETPPPQPQPTPPAKTETKKAQVETDESETLYARNAVLVGISHDTNYFERHTQFYRYSSSMTMLDASVRFDEFKIYGTIALPSTPSGGLIPATYKNSGFWLLGLEQQARFRRGYQSWARYGVNYRSFGGPNPAGILVRDTLHWSFTSYADAGLHFFNAGPVAIGFLLASHLDLMSAQPALSNDSNFVLLWNIEGGLFASYLIPVIKVRSQFAVDTSYALIDDTSKVYVVSPFSGSYSLEGTGRTGNFSGIRYRFSFSRSYKGVLFNLQYFAYPNITTAFQPVDEQNKPRSSAGYLRFSAEYQWGF